MHEPRQALSSKPILRTNNAVESCTTELESFKFNRDIDEQAMGQAVAYRLDQALISFPVMSKNSTYR